MEGRSVSLHIFMKSKLIHKLEAFKMLLLYREGHFPALLDREKDLLCFLYDLGEKRKVAFLPTLLCFCWGNTAIHLHVHIFSFLNGCLGIFLFYS